MKLIRLALDRPVATLVVFTGGLLLGLISLRQLPVDLLPDISFPRLAVLAEYPGASPEEMTRLVTEPLEADLGAVPDVRHIGSVSFSGGALITLEFHWGTDMDFALLHTRERLEKARQSLPRDMRDAPRILQFDPASRPVLLLSLSHPDQRFLEEFTRDVLKPRLEQLDGVAVAEVAGARHRIVRVELDPAATQARGLSPADVAQAVTTANVTTGSGLVAEKGRRYSLRVEGELEALDQIRLLPLSHDPKSPLLVGDVARVGWDLAEAEGAVTLNGQPAVSLQVFKEAGANTVAVSDRVATALEQIGREYPEVTVFRVLDEARYIRSAVTSLAQAMVIGGILVIAVMALFLGSLRQALVIGVVIPLAIIYTFNLMFFRDMSLNLMSLGGLVLGIGLFVDNSIVIMESIDRHRLSGLRSRRAAAEGTAVVAAPIVASTLTTVAVFLPVVYLRGITAELFRDEAVTVTFALLAALAVSLTLLPVLAVLRRRDRSPVVDDLPPIRPRTRLGRGLHFGYRGLAGLLMLPVWALANVGELLRRLGRGPGRLTGRLLGPVGRRLSGATTSAHQAVYHRYHRLLLKVLDHPGPALALLGLLLLATGWLPLTLPRELLPAPETAYFQIEALFPEDYALESIQGITRQVEEHLDREPALEWHYTEVGRVRPGASADAAADRHRVWIYGRVAQPADLPVVAAAATRAWQTFPEVHARLAPEEVAFSRLLAGGGENWELTLTGPDPAVLGRIADRLRGRLEVAVPGESLQLEPSGSAREYRVRLDRVNLRKHSLLSGAVNHFITDALRGAPAGTLRQMEHKYDIRVLYPDPVRRSWARLRDLTLTAGDHRVPLRELARLDTDQAPEQIWRQDQNRIMVLRSATGGESAQRLRRALPTALAGLALPDGYRVLPGGRDREQQTSTRALVMAFALSALLVFMILAAQFESLRLPALIILAVPMGLVGVFVALTLCGQSINIVSLIGMIVLVGVVVNDAIIKVDCMHRHVRAGQPLRQAILAASEEKFRPVVMTTVTTVLGLLPAAIGLGEGAELQRSLAIGFIGGMISGTVLTLLYTPLFFQLLERRLAGAPPAAGGEEPPVPVLVAGEDGSC